MTRKILIGAPEDASNDTIVVKRNGNWSVEDYTDFTTEDKTKLSNIQPKAEINVQSDWNELDANSDAYIQNKPSALTPTVHAGTHAKAGSDPLTLDGSQITSGMIDASHVPSGTFQKLVVVTDEAARKALTSSDVNNGDTVKQNDTGIMYLVKDNTKLSTDDGWAQYTAVTPWSAITDKPSMPVSTSVTILLTQWDESTLKTTVEVAGVTESCSVIVTPSPESFEFYEEARVLCASQTTNQLTFSCKTIPTANLLVNILIIYT